MGGGGTERSDEGGGAERSDEEGGTERSDEGGVKTGQKTAYHF